MADESNSTTGIADLFEAEWMNAWTSGWMNGWIDGSIKKKSSD